MTEESMAWLGWALMAREQGASIPRAAAFASTVTKALRDASRETGQGEQQR